MARFERSPAAHDPLSRHVNRNFMGKSRYGNRDTVSPPLQKERREVRRSYCNRNTGKPISPYEESWQFRPELLAAPNLRPPLGVCFTLAGNFVCSEVFTNRPGF